MKPKDRRFTKAHQMGLTAKRARRYPWNLILRRLRIIGLSKLSPE